MILAVLFLIAGAAAAQPERGYVVRVDGGAVWLDLTAADGAAPGRRFEIYAEGTPLTHPVTGADLGRASREVAEGEVRDVADKFSMGAIVSRTGEVSAGQRARLTATQRPGEVEVRAPKTRGASLDYAVNAMAVGDFDGAGSPQIALASENAIRLYSYPAIDGKALAEAVVPGAGLRILGLEASGLEGGGRDALLVCVYDQAFARLETRVYKLEDGRWRKTAELPFLTRGYQNPKGERVLAAQQILEDKSFPFGAIYPLVYEDGRYAQGRPALGLPGVDDRLFGFTTASFGAGKTAVISLSAVHALAIRIGKESLRSADDDYGQTPVRVRWQDRQLEFNAPMAAVYGDRGFDSLVAARNLAALGGLGGPFGLFGRGELVAERWNGLALETAWKADLPGVAQGLAAVAPAPGRTEIAAAIRGADGRSSVWTFAP